MSFTKEQLLEAHRLSSNNYTKVAKSLYACCFYCCERFLVDIRSVNMVVNRRNNTRTAFHVACGVDAIIADSQTELAKDMRFVAAMRYYWFDIDSPYETTEEENG